MPKAAAARTSWPRRAGRASPYLQVEIYRPGGEIRRFADPKAEIAAARLRSGRSRCGAPSEPLASKFGPLSIVTFETSKGDAAPLPRLRARL